MRSGTSPALNYGEAQSAESRSDFIHKLKVVLKELRETSISLKKNQRTEGSEPPEILPSVMQECEELRSVFVRSIVTSRAGGKKS